MEIITLVFALVVYVLICYWVCRLYLAAAIWANKFFESFILRNLVIYFFLLVFLAIELPFAVFFPFWFNEQLVVFVSSPEITGNLIIFGSIVLGGSGWAALRSKDGREYSKTMA